MMVLMLQQDDVCDCRGTVLLFIASNVSWTVREVYDDVCWVCAILSCAAVSEWVFVRVRDSQSNLNRGFLLIVM